MKTSVVPAQITTVEDMIVGKIGLTQLLLLSMPIFASLALYAVLPPGLHDAVYKLILFAFLILTGCTLAVRLKGKLVLFWLITLLRYFARPHVYVFDKCSNHDDNFLYGVSKLEYAPPDEPLNIIDSSSLSGGLIPINELVLIEEHLTNSHQSLAYRPTKNGAINVSYKQIG